MKGFIITLTAGLLLVCGCGSSAGLYSWEKDEIRPIADAVICYGGHSARKPYLWTTERFHETVAYTDENGQEHWFFDNMIMMELWDDDYAVTYSIANDGRYSSSGGSPQLRPDVYPLSGTGLFYGPFLPFRLL